MNLQGKVLGFYSYKEDKSGSTESGRAVWCSWLQKMLLFCWTTVLARAARSNSLISTK